MTNKMTYEEYYEYCSKRYFDEDHISTLAYDIWERDGRPDGEVVGSYGNKIKDMHWFEAIGIASILLELDFDFLWMAYEL